MELKQPGQLRLIHHIQESTAPERGVDIVVVPGIWIEHSSGRAKSSCSWIKPLAASMTGDTRVFLFVYHLELDGSSLWEQLLGLSYPLVAGLDQSRVDVNHLQRPLLFIGQSLGGLIVKRALSLGVRSRQAYQDVTSGIIFLGTPHLVDASAEGWENLKLLMKGNRKDISKHNMTESEMELVISACQQFDNLHLPIPLMSVYELRETKVRESLFNPLRRKRNYMEVLVSRTMVQINAPREVLIDVDKTHGELGVVEEDEPLYLQLVNFFTTFMQHAPKNVESASRPLPPPEMPGMHLRPKSSVSSFWTSSYPEDTPIYTPRARSSESGDGAAQLALQSDVPGAEVPPPPPEGSVQFPFSHTASVARNHAFYGRTDVLDDIDQVFGLKACAPADGASDQHGLDFADTPKSYVLCGMAGIGKTDIASEYFYSRRGFFDAVIWVYADTARKMAAQYVALAKALGQGQEAVSDGMDEVSARNIVNAWLASPVGHRTENGNQVKVEGKWLMVFDNADDPDILSDWLPDHGPGCILVTSKYPYVRENVYRLTRGMDLETFQSDVGADMLRKLSGHERDADSVAASIRVVERLGGLPLAIVQMSAIIRKNHLTFRDFEEWYDEDAKHLHYLRESGMKSSYQHTIGTAWAIERLSPFAFALLKVLSVLDPDRIPEELLTDGAKEVELPNYPVKKQQYFTARADLIHLSLVTRNMATNELKVHRLVQDVVRHKLAQAELHAVYAGVALLISSVWPYVCGTDPTRNQAWRVPIAERYTPHINKLEALLGPEVRASRFYGTAASGYLFSSYAWYISERGIHGQSAHFASLAQAILRRSVERGLGDEERTTHWLGEAHHTASLAACVSGSSDGIEEAQSWLAILHQRIEKYNQSSDKLALATAYNQIAICLMNKNQVEGAIDNFRKSLTAFKEVEDRPRFSGTFPAISLSNLVCLVQRQPDEAEQVLTPALEEHERILGVDDTTTTESGHIWRAMGNIRNGQGRYSEALAYHERAVENMRITLGEKHYFTGDCLYSLAVDLIRQGHHERALEALDSAISAFSASSVSEGSAARAVWKKGCLLKEKGDKEASNEFLERAMKLRQKLAPNDSRRLDELKEEDWTKLCFYWSW